MRCLPLHLTVSVYVTGTEKAKISQKQYLIWQIRKSRYIILSDSFGVFIKNMKVTRKRADI